MPARRTIGKLAREAGVNVETVRFYERRGLIPQPPKPAEGFRHYPDETLNRIRFIKRAQELGFSLEEIAGLLSLSDQPCTQVQTLAHNKLNALQEKIADLKRLESALKTVVKKCESNPDKEHCPVIDALQP